MMNGVSYNDSFNDVVLSHAREKPHMHRKVLETLGTDKRKPRPFIKVFFFALLLVLSAGLVSAALTDGLQLAADFTGGTVTADFNTANASDFTNVGTTACTDVRGSSNGARCFDGTNDQLTNLATLIPNTNTPVITIQYWVNVSSFPGTTPHYYSNNASASPYLRAFQNSNGTTSIDPFDGVNNPSTTAETLGGAGGYSMVTHIIDDVNGRLYVYINDTLWVNKSLGTLNNVYKNSLFRVGTNGNAGNGYFHGSMDLWKVWHRALTPADVSALYNGGSGCLYSEMSTDCSTIPSFTMSASDEYTGGSLTNFSVLFDSFDSILSTTTGTLLVNTTTDMSGNGNDATNNGATYNSTAEAYEFDGSTQYLELSNFSVNGTWNISVTASTSDPDFMSLLGDQNNTYGYFGIRPSTLQFSFEPSTGDISCFQTIGGNTNDGNEYTYTAVSNTTHILFYLDGVFQSSCAVSSSQLEIDYIAAGYTGLPNRYWNGSISRVIISQSGYESLDFSFTDWDSHVDNLTVSSGVSGGYFNRTYSSYNTSSDLSAELVQSIVGFSAVNRVSNASVTDFTVSTSDNGGSATNTSTTPSLYLTAGSYTFTYNKTGWYDSNLTATATAVTSSEEEFSVYDHKLNLSLQMTGETDTTQDFNVSIYSADGYDFNEFLTTTNGAIIANLTHGNYTVILNDSLHSQQSYNISLNDTNTFTNYTLIAANINQIDISFYDLTTSSLILQNVNVTLVGSIATYTDNTSNGTVTLDLLNPDTYTVTAESNGYNPSTQYVTLNNDNQTLNMYLESASSVTDITFTIQDTLGNRLENATMTITTNINGSFVTVAQRVTGFSGIVVVALDQTREYFFTVTHPDYATFEGSETPTQTTYTISLSPSSATEYESVFSDVQWQRSVTANTNLTNATVTLDIVSSSGILQWYGYSFTYNGTAYVTNTSGSPSGGTETTTFLIDPSVNRCVNVTWYFKAAGFDRYNITDQTCFSTVSPDGRFVLSNLFVELEDLSTGAKAVIATIILVLSIVSMLYLSRSMSAAALVGAAMTGALTYKDLFPAPAGYVVMMLVFIIVVASEVVT